MRNGRIGTLHLTGEDAACFVHSFFCPSVEEIREHEVIRARRSEQVTVKSTNDGFTGDVADLDLSFLKEEFREEQVSVTVTMSIKVQTNDFCSANENSLPQMVAQMFVPAPKTEFTSCNTNEIAQMAA